MKVPADERWDALSKLDVEDQGSSSSWMLPKEIVRMARTMPPAEAKRFFKNLQPDVCAAAFEQVVRYMNITFLCRAACGGFNQLLQALQCCHGIMHLARLR